MRNGFTFGNQNSWDFGLRVEKLPTIGSPKRRVTAITVPGRSGNLHIDEGVYESYTQPYECYFHGKAPTAEVTHAIRTWLMSGSGPRKLTDEYDPKHYHMATFIGPLDVANILNRYGRCTITFEVDPRAYLRSGTEPIRFTAPNRLSNLTGYPAQPLIRMEYSGEGELTVGDRTVKLYDTASGELYIDCETMDAYRGEENMNRLIGCEKFPVLAPGANDISWTGGIQAVEITPRWWVL